MSVLEAADRTVVVRRPHKRRLRALRDMLAVAGRNLTTIRRVPQLLVFTLIQPVIFVVLFRYVMGGAIRVPGVSYVNYLIPGVFVQAVTFGSIQTAIGLAADLKSGLLERFRSLPMARSALLSGRTIADLVRLTFVVSVITGVGFLLGFRVQTGPLPFIAGLLLVLLFAYTLSWVFALVGLTVGDPESAQAASFPVMFPLVFASSAFVPVASMPWWLQGFAEHQPVSVTASAVRALALGGPTRSFVLQSVAWSIGILLVMVPLAVRRYRKAI
ncbi:MAG: ABC transporter permease [Actinomycetota bacterium]|nr:ABC transporter permease [Actinomycetota bacterium]